MTTIYIFDDRARVPAAARFAADVILVIQRDAATGNLRGAADKNRHGPRGEEAGDPLEALCNHVLAVLRREKTPQEGFPPPEGLPPFEGFLPQEEGPQE